MDYPIPRASAESWRKHRQKSPQNPGLIFDRFVPLKGPQPDKREGLRQVLDAAERGDRRLLGAWNRRWEAAARACGADPVGLRTEWRLIVGLGRKGALEVGFAFHRYGFPLLLGSGLKGVARSAGLIALAEALSTADHEDLDRLLGVADEPEFRRQFASRYSDVDAETGRLALRFRRIFGTTAAAGGAIFFDAIPREQPRLELDIMNPHYPRYYGDSGSREAPADSQNPIPVYFLTVAPRTLFRFAVGWRGPGNTDDAASRTLAKEWLISGVTELGAGAKTSAGYGYFTSLRE